MRPSSLLFTIFGDYYRNLRMEVWVGSLIKYLEPFGFSDGSVRVTLSRMMHQGWLESRKVGQKSFYRVTDKGLRRIKHGVTRVYQDKDEPWDGKWRIVMTNFPENLRETREQIRKELQWMGFGYLGNNVWVTPNNLYAQVMEMIDEYQVRAFMDFFTATYDGPQIGRGLAQKAWNLDEIAMKYEQFVSAFQPHYEKMYQTAKQESLSEDLCFVQRALLVHEYRKFLFVDPNLPKELLPSDWIGTEAAHLFREFHHFLTPMAEKYFYDHLVTPDSEKEDRDDG